MSFTWTIVTHSTPCGYTGLFQVKLAVGSLDA